MQATLAFLGLGVMGYPMAGHWSRTSHSVRVFNRTQSKSDAWITEHSGTQCTSVADAVNGADVIALCVGNDDDVRELMNAILPHLKPGAVVIDHTTTSAHLAHESASRCEDRAVLFIDAPVSGGERGAQRGELTIMCGGSNEAFETAKPYMNYYAKHLSLMGPVGAGQLTKMVNQICIAGLLQGLSEGIQFAQHAGLSVEAVVDVISQGAAQSWQMDNRARTMDRGDYLHGFAVNWMRKDLDICLDAAASMNTSLPVTALVNQFYQDVQALGGGRWDTSSLLARLQALNKAKPT